MKQKKIKVLLTITFIVVLFWIGFNIYHNAVTSTISEPLAHDIIPIEPRFNTGVIERLKQRQSTTPLYNFVNIQASNSASQPATPSATPPSITPQQNASPAAQIITNTTNGSL